MEMKEESQRDRLVRDVKFHGTRQKWAFELIERAMRSRFHRYFYGKDHLIEFRDLQRSAYVDMLYARKVLEDYDARHFRWR